MRRLAKGLARKTQAAFSEAADDLAAQVDAALSKLGVLKVAKVDDPSDHGDGPSADEAITPIIEAPALGEASVATAERVVAGLDFSALDVLFDIFDPGLFEAGVDTRLKALAQVGVADVEQLTNRVNEAAVAYARDRAAELVGKQWRNGVLIDNPNPAWSISETTRKALRSTIADGLENNIGRAAIADAIQANYAFSPERAATVANTEIRTVNEQSKLDEWREAAGIGLTIRKAWQISNDLEEVCKVCLANAAQGAIPLEDDFQSGDDASPAHPDCQCATVPEVDDIDDDEDDEDA